MLPFTNFYHGSLATKAWSLLREQLEKNPDKGSFQRCVARKLITTGAQLPQWLVERYKVSYQYIYHSFFPRLGIYMRLDPACNKYCDLIG